MKKSDWYYVFAGLLSVLVVCCLGTMLVYLAVLDDKVQTITPTVTMSPTPLPTQNVRGENLEYVLKVKSIMQANTKTLNETGILFEDEALLNVNRQKWIEDEISKYNQLIATGSYAIIIPVPHKYRSVWKELRKINYEYAIMRESFEQYYVKGIDSDKNILEESTKNTILLHEHLLNILEELK